MAKDDPGRAAPWRRTLLVMWVAEFIAVGGISLAMPFLPLYLNDLGVADPAQAQRWAGILISANFLAAAFVAPVWGILADRYGRKPMAMRAIFGLAVSIGLMAFARNPFQLLLLRLLQGGVGGFVAASVALVATQVPKERLGYALGTLQTSLTAGGIVGPLLGGLLADALGYSRVFLITGGFCVVAGLVVAVFVRERFTPLPPEERFGLRDNLAMLRDVPALRATFGIIMLTQIGLMVIQPILPLFIRDLGSGSENLLRTKVGLTYSMPGIAVILAAPLWGRRGDRRGHRISLALALLGSGMLYLPQGLSRSVLQLILMRFCMGLFTAGISPAANSVVAGSAPKRRTAGALSLLTTAQWFGAVLGPLLGGFLAVHLGVRPIFLVTGTLLLCSGASALHAARRPAPKPVVEEAAVGTG